MSFRPPLADLTAEQLRELARKNREMAATATTTDARDALIRLAERLERLAVERER
jgi:hypothetical protein